MLVFAFADHPNDVAVMPYPTPTDLPPHAADKARQAVLMGTRALIAESRFDALVSLLVASGAVPAESANKMLSDLSATLKGHAADGHSEWRTHPAELRMEAERLERRAVAIRT